MDVVESVPMVHTLLNISCLSQWRLASSAKTGGRRLQASRWLRAYAVVVLLVSVALLCAGIGLQHATAYADGSNQTQLDATMYRIQLIGVRVAHIVTLLEALLRHKQEARLWHKFRELDAHIERCVHVPPDNSRVRRSLQRQAIANGAVYLVAELLFLSNALLKGPPGFVAFWLLHLLPMLVCGVRYFQVYAAVALIQARCDLLIAVLSALTAHPDSGSNAANTNASHEALRIYFIGERLHYPQQQQQKPPLWEQQQHRQVTHLTAARDLYNRLWEATALLNHCFGISLLVNVGNDFISITSSCYWIFLNFQLLSSTLWNFMAVAAWALWSAPHLYNLIALAIICERTIKCRTTIALALHRLELNVENENHNALIEQFSLQLLHQKLSFSAAGFFSIDCSLLYTIVGAITTYLIILIQFHMSDQSRLATT